MKTDVYTVIADLLQALSNVVRDIPMRLAELESPYEYVLIADYSPSFSVRTRNILRNMEIRTIGELMKVSADELNEQRNAGITSIAEIRKNLAANGMCLKGEVVR